MYPALIDCDVHEGHQLGQDALLEYMSEEVAGIRRAWKACVPGRRSPHLRTESRGGITVGTLRPSGRRGAWVIAVEFMVEQLLDPCWDHACGADRGLDFALRRRAWRIRIWGARPPGER